MKILNQIIINGIIQKEKHANGSKIIERCVVQNMENNLKILEELLMKLVWHANKNNNNN